MLMMKLIHVVIGRMIRELSTNMYQFHGPFKQNMKAVLYYDLYWLIFGKWIDLMNQ